MLPTFIGTDFVRQNGYASFKMEEVAREVEQLKRENERLKREVEHLKDCIEVLMDNDELSKIITKRGKKK